MKNTFISLAMVSTLLAGCASIQYGDKGVENDLKKFTPVPGKTRLYVCRENALLVAAGVSTGVLVDNQNIGTVKPNTFVHAVIEPGKHDVLMKNDRIMSATGARISVETKADELRFLWIGVTGRAIA